MKIALLIMENHGKNHGIVFLNFCGNPVYCCFQEAFIHIMAFSYPIDQFLGNRECSGSVVECLSQD